MARSDRHHDRHGSRSWCQANQRLSAACVDDCGPSIARAPREITAAHVKAAERLLGDYELGVEMVSGGKGYDRVDCVGPGSGSATTVSMHLHATSRHWRLSVVPVPASSAGWSLTIAPSLGSAKSFRYSLAPCPWSGPLRGRY